MIRRNGIVHGGAVVLRKPWDARHAMYHIVDGPVLPADPALAEEVLFTLLTTVQHRRAREPVIISHLRLEPRWDHLPEYVRGLGAMVVGPPRRFTTIDLGASETGLLAKMAPPMRSRIALARQLRIRTSEETGPAGVEALLAMVEGEAPNSTGAPTSDASRLLPLLHSPGRGGIFFAEDGITRLAGAATVHFGNRATLLLAAAAVSVPDAPAAALLQFEVMRRAKHRHCLEYDLGSLSGQSRLFEGIGGPSRDLVGTVDIILDAGAHAAFRSKERTSAADVEGLLGVDV